MNSTTSTPLILPALRGIMGDWVYYSCLMNMNELSTRVDYAGGVHKHEMLSDMIQRQLDGVRSTVIATYLKTQPQRFFNSLVVATYGGSPDWHALSDIQVNSESSELAALSQRTIESVGFLTLRGDEKLFALDGQHRLAGIKKVVNVVNNGLDNGSVDEVSVIFVAHIDDVSGLERTRRLFTTLNKTARPVSKGDIIALDEDDVMAICVRRLIEETDGFSGDRIAFVATNSMPSGNKTSLTTIGNLYDVLQILFTDSQFEQRKRKSDLQRVRPEDDELEAYFRYAKSYFSCLSDNFEELHEFFSASEYSRVVQGYRGRHGGNALFRPIGLEIFTKIIARLTKEMALSEATRLVSRLPRELNQAPYVGLMWDPHSQTIVSRHKVTLREVLYYMLHRSTKSFPESKLLQKYRRETGNEDARLPRQLV